MSRQPDELPPVPGERNAPGASRRVPDGGNVISVRAVMVYVPRAFYRAAGRSCVNRAAIFPSAAPAFSGLAAVASGTGNRAVCVNDGAAVPAEAAQYYADLV